METNMETVVETVKSDDFKHTLIKIAIATMAGVIAKKIAEATVDHVFNRNQTVTIEKTN